MTVEVRAAPHDTTAAYGDEERVHSAFFLGAVIAVILSLLVVALSRVWAVRAEELVVFPMFDQTALMQGQATFHADPTTLLPLATPQVERLEDVRRTQTPSLLGNKAVVLTTDAVTLAGTKKGVVAAQYAIDIRSLQNIRGAAAWSFAGGNAVERAPAYSVNLPFDTGPGPYAIWLNEAGRAITFTRQGQPFEINGILVERLRGHLDPAPVDPLYVAELSHAGIPAGLTLEQLGPMLQSLGDGSANGLATGLRPSMTGDELATLGRPVSLDYTMSADFSLLVEPRTGTIVSVDSADEAFSGRLDPAGMATLTALLGRHSTVPGAGAALPLLARLAAASPAPIFDMKYAQTPASVKAMSGYAAGQRDWINRMTRVIPTTLFAIGLALAGLGVLLGVTAWRRRNLVYEYEGEEE